VEDGNLVANFQMTLPMVLNNVLHIADAKPVIEKDSHEWKNKILQ